MEIQRLPWAGVRVTLRGSSVMIDPVTRIPERFGGARETMYPLAQFGATDAVLLTHLHEDHFDPDAIVAAYGANIPVYAPADVADAARAAGLGNVIAASVGEVYGIPGGVSVIPVPSVDGVGDVQVGWVVKGDGRTAIHCGDTLWHGYWWSIAQAYGPIDAACLPVNGAVLELPGRTASGQPICLTPEQAVAAAHVLGAGTLVPIHYKAIHHPPVYRETPDIEARLRTAAEGKVGLSLIGATETVTV
ncbi:MBL fold metallo-hydrolase [Cohnella sp.]|uniref:MBL fold metallo-hydrolase n=1 Tax=Cohnella sp. TaxID=1883426 RepID=UPI003567512D